MCNMINELEPEHVDERDGNYAFPELKTTEIGSVAVATALFPGIGGSFYNKALGPSGEAVLGKSKLCHIRSSDNCQTVENENNICRVCDMHAVYADLFAVLPVATPARCHTVSARTADAPLALCYLVLRE